MARTPRISLIAMEARDPAKAFVRVPNEPGRWVLTDRCVVEVACDCCLAGIGEPCHNRNGQYGVGTHHVRRTAWHNKRPGRVGIHIEDESAKPRMRVLALMKKVKA